MPSTAQLKLIEDLLNLPNFKVVDYINQENVGMIVQVIARNQKATCTRCGKKVKNYIKIIHLWLKIFPWANNKFI